MKKLLLYYHTLKYLWWQQVFYKLWYTLIKPAPAFTTGKLQAHFIEGDFLPFHNATTDGIAFEMLNKQVKFEDKIDWDYNDLGALWRYNLNYFDYLNDPELGEELGLSLIFDYCQNRSKTSMEPYPTSLRGVNWIKYLSKHQNHNPDFTARLFLDYSLLYKRPEYHLLGNHLLENGISLLFGAFFFHDEKFFNKANKIITSELHEEILEDGGHYELSPMYHCIILHRLLDCLVLLDKNKTFGAKQDKLEHLIREKAAKMVSWLQNVTFTNGDIPLVNDAAEGIAPRAEELLQFATKIGIEPASLPLKDSRYRKLSTNQIEAVVDIGQIGPDYIPGHAHADTFNFVLYHQGQPVIVDTGISTYNMGAQRDWERGTAAHNTVVVNGQNSSEVWAGFRVARRAKTRVLEDTPAKVIATHDGYSKLGVEHKRSFEISEGTFTISDDIGGAQGVFHLHFHHGVNPVLTGEKVEVGGMEISFNGFESIEMLPYQQALGFNKQVESKKVEVLFKGQITVTFAPK